MRKTYLWILLVLALSALFLAACSNVNQGQIRQG